jgi:hypothetical protein
LPVLHNDDVPLEITVAVGDPGSAAG